MPVLDFNAFCVNVEAGFDPKSIRFPGGLEINQFIPNVIPPLKQEIATDLIGKLNTALAPLQPVFNVIEVVLAIFECLKAVATFDPAEIAKCFPNLAQRINALLALLPQFSLPFLIADVITCIIDLLEAQILVIQDLLSFKADILDAVELNGQLAHITLDAGIDCAEAHLSAILDNLNANQAPLNRLIGIINAFLKLLGLPCIPGLSALSIDVSATAYLVVILDILAYIRGLLNFELPFVSLVIDAVGLDSEC